MSKYYERDIDAITEDLKQVLYAENPIEATDEILLKKSKKELEKIYQLCEGYIYIFDKVFKEK